MKNPISGKTLRFTFDDGPMARKSFDHTFHDDGSLTFKMDEGKETKVEKYEVATLGADVTVVSYLGSGGYTLTVALDTKSKKLVAFSSNEKGVSVQHGSFTEQNAGETRTARDTMRSASHN